MIKRKLHSALCDNVFLHHIIHEFRNPLTILKGEIEFALKKNRSKKTLETVLLSNLDEVNRLALIVENLSLLTKFENGEMIVQKRPININNLINNIIENFKTLSLQNNIEINFIQKKKIFLNADENCLRILFMNLLGEIIRRGPKKSNILVNIIKINNFALIKILNKEIIIFKEFLSIKNVNLGFNVSKYILKAHNAKLKIEDTNLAISLPISNLKKINN